MIIKGACFNVLPRVDEKEEFQKIVVVLNGMLL